MIFKYPDNTAVKAVFQLDKTIQSVSELSKPGFIFSPFGSDLPAVLLRPDHSATASLGRTNKPSFGDADQSQPAEDDAEQFENMVSRAIRSIKEGKLKKVVLSRRLEVQTKKSALEIFEELVWNYPSAFCYCWYHPAVGCWAGATPEVLLQFKDSWFSTVALAGTLPKSDAGSPQWGKKEEVEQQVVTRYIQQVLTDKGIEAKISDVKTTEAGSLWHLKTTISGRATTEQVAKIVQALHPTPAVCGIPLEDARNFILKNERYPRKYYTGFLGELQPEKGEFSLFVNLRCMELIGSSAHIFVGGGITEDSDPRKEWEETRAKSQTILKVL